MSSPSKGSRQIVKLGQIESLIEEGKFKEALAEIREVEIRKDLDRFSHQWGWFSYLASKALQGVGRCEEAAGKAQEALKMFQNTQENEKLARIQFNLGIIYSDLGEPRDSELQFRDAASTYRRSDDKRGVIRTYNELSRICFTRAKYDQAVEYLSDGAEYCEEIKDQKLAAAMYGNLGTVYVITDRWSKAREELLKSLNLNKSCKNEVNVCRSYLSLGNVSILLREFAQAEEYLKKAERIVYDSSLAREAAIFHEYAGQLAFVQGEFDAAHQHYGEAVKLGQQIAPRSAIISQAYRLLADLQAEEGDYQEALASCEKSLQVSKDIGEKIEEAVVYRILGKLYSQDGKQAGEVRDYFERGAQMMEEMGVKCELVKTYLDMSRCDAFDLREKMKFLGRAEDLASQLDSPYYLASVQVSFAELFIRNEEPAAAQDFLSKAKSVFEELDEKGDLEVLAALEKKIQAPRPASQVTCRDSSEDLSLDAIITQDRTTLDILESIRQIKDMDITILLEGETGTGKDLLAKIIHCTGNRKDKSFVVANCAAFPEALFESELFGHKKGSFTGAVADKKGLLHEADGGTVYLDEIAEVPLLTQVKLLRAIEEKEIMRIGEVKPRKVDFRVIAATNRNLDEMVQEGKFRSDLFYRLDVMRFKLPPLRKRRKDIPLLVEHFLKKHSFNGMRTDSAGDDGLSPSETPTVDPRILELFAVYDWPGNVRELENEVKKLLIASRGEKIIRFDHLDNNLEKFKNAKTTCSDGFPSLPKQQAEYEREQIERALGETNGVKTQAARLLGIDEALLRYKIKKHGIDIPRQQA